VVPSFFLSLFFPNSTSPVLATFSTREEEVVKPKVEALSLPLLFPLPPFSLSLYLSARWRGVREESRCRSPSSFLFFFFFPLFLLSLFPRRRAKHKRHQIGGVAAPPPPPFFFSFFSLYPPDASKIEYGRERTSKLPLFFFFFSSAVL